MSTAEKRPRLTIRQAQEADAAAVREILNETIEDRMGTFENYCTVTATFVVCVVLPLDAVTVTV
jgi:hypothetical protein